MGLQYGIKEVLNFSVIDFATKKPILYADYATVSSNENSAERLDLRGGQGNFKIMSFDHTKDSMLNVTMPLVDLKLLALLTGSDSVVGASDVFKREILTVSASNTVTLASTPVSGTLYMFDLSGDRDNGTEITVGTPATTPNTYSISGAIVTLNATSHVAGEQVVAFYQYAAPATSTKITIKANKFPKAVEIYGDGLWRNQEDELDYIVKVHALKARPQANFTFTMSASDATTLEITFDLYGVTNNVTGDIDFIEYVILS